MARKTSRLVRLIKQTFVLHLMILNSNLASPDAVRKQLQDECI